MGIKIKQLRLRIKAKLKDRASLLKSHFNLKRRVSSDRVLLLHATSHDPKALASDDHLAAIVPTNHTLRFLVNRLAKTRNCSVALKCLIVLHSLIKRGAFVYQSFPCFSGNGRSFLNLGSFLDKSDQESIEISSWVKWYADFVDQGLNISGQMGFFLSPVPGATVKHVEQRVVNLPNSQLLKDLSLLVQFVEQVCQVPESLELRKNDLIHAVVGLVREDYRLVQREIGCGVGEIRRRGLSQTELTHLVSVLERVEFCRKRLRLLFVNRCHNAPFWELIEKVKSEAAKQKREKEGGRQTDLVVVRLSRVY